MDYKLINEYKQQGKTYREIMELLGIPCDTHKDYDRFRKKIKYHAPRHIKDAGTFKDFSAYAASTLVDGAGNIKLAWVKSEAVKADMLANILKQIKDIPASDIQYTDIIKPKTLLEVATFDMHWGPNIYDDYKPHLIQIIRIMRNSHEHILITVGSDLFHHNDMRSNTASGTPIEQLNIRDAWQGALKFYIELITEAVKNSNHVTIKYIKGNHDESLSWAFVQTLKQLFPMCTFDDDFKERKVFTWENIFIGYIHGDKPINDIDRVFTREYRKELATAEIVEIHVGHTHKENVKGNTQDKQGVMVRVLSTSAKTDQWHDDQNYVGANKRFQLFEYGPSKLNAIYYVDGKA